MTQCNWTRAAGWGSWDGEAGAFDSPLGNGLSYSSCDFGAPRKPISRSSKSTRGCRTITNALFGVTAGGAATGGFDSPQSTGQSYVSCDFGVPTKPISHISKLTRGVSQDCE